MSAMSEKPKSVIIVGKFSVPLVFLNLPSLHPP